MPGTRESETRSRQRISIQGQRPGRRWLERDSRDSRGERDKGSAGPTGGVDRETMTMPASLALGIWGSVEGSHQRGLDHWQLAWPHPSSHCGL